MRWRLTLPVRTAFRCAERLVGPVCPREVAERLRQLPVKWQDRAALWQAPRDADHPVAHVLVNVACTPGWRFALAYLFAVAVPDRKHMGRWYRRRHRGWLPWAHVVRWLRPIIARVWRLAKTQRG